MIGGKDGMLEGWKNGGLEEWREGWMNGGMVRDYKGK